MQCKLTDGCRLFNPWLPRPPVARRPIMAQLLDLIFPIGKFAPSKFDLQSALV
jgi:hypothetical protein